MRDLNFHKRRKNTSAGRTRKRGRGSGHSLHFETEKKELRFARERRAGRRSADAKEILLWAVEILIVCMTAVLLVAAFGQQVNVTGDSMSPVLRNGDTALVNRFIYQIKKPARGDIIAFRQSENGQYSIKRVVGLPGETVQIEDGTVLIDGEELTEDLSVSDIAFEGTAREPVELGGDEYFVIGDNHTASDDSRTQTVGNISGDEIYGKVWFVADPWKHMGFAD